MYVGQILFQFSTSRMFIGTGVTIYFPITFSVVYGAVATSDGPGGVYVSNVSTSQFVLDTGSSGVYAYCFAYGTC
jgi:hypothetical protein